MAGEGAATIFGEALLLRAVDFGESDRIVHLLTRDRGRLTAIAKGARKSRKRFPGTLDVFNRLRVEGRVRPRAEMAFLERAELLDAFLGLREAPRRYALASFLIELLDRMAPEALPAAESRPLYDFAVESLSLLCEVEPDVTLRLLLELRAFDALGLRPELSRCVRCGRVAEASVEASHPVSFHVADGGLVCTACGLRLDGLVPATLGTLRQLESGLCAPVGALPEIRLAPEALAEASRLVFRFQRFHLGVELRSDRFLAEMLPEASAAPT